MTDIDIVAELRRKIGGRDGNDGVIGVTFGEMRSLLDAIESDRAYHRFREADPAKTTLTSAQWWAKSDRLRMRRDKAFEALERSDEG